MHRAIKKEFPDKIIQYILIAFTVIYGFACVYLYYNQLFFVEGKPFESDLPFHVSMAVDDKWFYSLTAILYQLFFMTSIGNQLTALFLGVVSVATIFATYELLQQLTEKKYFPSMMLFFAVLSNFIMPFYLSFAHGQRYIGYQSSSIWHNSTYTCMKFLGIITLIYYFKCEKKYRENLPIKDWLIFATLLVICNGVKPSFCMIFAPAMAVYLLIDLGKKVSFRKVFWFGLSVIPSLLVIIWQNMVLFGDETGNGIVFNPGFALFMRGDHPKVTFILSMAFPLLMLIFTLTQIFREKKYGFMWTAWLFGFLQIFLFTEQGRRAKDSNFFWGYSCGLFLINVMAMVKLLELRQRREGAFSNKMVSSVVTAVGILCLSYQVWCGLYFFGQLLTGRSYWM